MPDTAQPCARLTRDALIPAAGMGERLGLGPKAFLRCGTQTLLERVVTEIRPFVDNVLVTVPPGYRRQAEQQLGPHVNVFEGGASRQSSIDIMLAESQAHIVLIHDVARPFAPGTLFDAVLQAAELHGAAGAFLDPQVPVGFTSDGQVARQWPREGARIFQAPQAFKRDILDRAIAASAGRQFQSTAQMVIEAGFALADVPGLQENIKITTPFDWLIAQRVIAPMQAPIQAPIKGQ